MKSTTVSHSASGNYYEGGHMYSASAGSVSMIIREDGLVRYEKHYYAHLGNMMQELSREEYLTQLAHIISCEGKKHERHGCTLMVFVSTKRDNSIYTGDWTKQEAEVAGLSQRERERKAVAYMW